MFTEREMLFVRSALSPSPADNADHEWQNAAVLFFRTLRARKATAAEFEPNGNGQVVVIPQTKPDYGLTVMPWGKHRGELFKDIPPRYLVFALGWIEEDPERKTKMKDLADAIRAFLAQ